MQNLSVSGVSFVFEHITYFRYVVEDIICFSFRVINNLLMQVGLKQKGKSHNFFMGFPMLLRAIYR